MKVGIVGLGQMGAGFAERLLAGGEQVIGWNRTKARATVLLEKGMQWAESPREVVEAAEITLTMLSNGPVLDAVLDGDRGVLAGISGRLLVEMSTISPEEVKALAVRVTAAGGELLDAPVLGNHISLATGKLLIMVGGSEAALARARPALQVLASKVFRVGEVGQGKVMKLALNLSLATQMLAFSEGLLVAVKSGIPRDVALPIMLGGASASPMLQYRAPLITAEPYPAWFDCTMMQKDVELALALGAKVGSPMPTTETANLWLTKAREAGLAHHDFSILYYVLARAAGDSFEIPIAKNDAT